MKYNRAFIEAVYSTAQNNGNDAAEEVFNKLFDINTQPVQEKTVAVTNSVLHSMLNNKVGRWVYLSDIQTANIRSGRPGLMGTNAGAWIKEYRTLTSSGLKESKDVYDFVRDHPEFDAS